MATNLTMYPGGGYKSPTSIRVNENVGSASSNAMQIVGSNNVLQKEESVQLAQDAKIIGGDNAEAFSTTVKTTVGDNSSLYMAQMDQNTRETLDQALTIVGANSNNFMAWAAGRDPDKPAVDESVEVSAKGAATASVLKTPAVRALLIGGVVVIAVYLWKGSK